MNPPTRPLWGRPRDSATHVSGPACRGFRRTPLRYRKRAGWDNESVDQGNRAHATSKRGCWPQTARLPTPLPTKQFRWGRYQRVFGARCKTGVHPETPHECLRCAASLLAQTDAKRTPGIHYTVNIHAGQIASNSQITHAVTHIVAGPHRRPSGSMILAGWRLRRVEIRSLNGVGSADLRTLPRGFARTISPARQRLLNGLLRSLSCAPTLRAVPPPSRPALRWALPSLLRCLRPIDKGPRV